VAEEVSGSVNSLQYCSQCGKQCPPDELVTLSGLPVCWACKPVFVQRLREGVTARAAVVHAGVWIRAWAVFLDSLIQLVVLGCLILLGYVVGFSIAEDEDAAMAVIFLAELVAFLGMVVYESWFVFHKGATPGKMACGLRVVTVSGGPLSWGVVIGRSVAKAFINSSCAGVGALVAAVDDEKRGLHDRMCGTWVIRA